MSWSTSFCRSLPIISAGHSATNPQLASGNVLQSPLEGFGRAIPEDEASRSLANGLKLVVFVGSICESKDLCLRQQRLGVADYIKIRRRVDRINHQDIGNDLLEPLESRQ